MTLRAQGLTTGYRRGAPVLRDIDALLEGGKVTVVVGPNAAGKSTLLRALAGVLDAWSGVVLLDGAALSSLPARRRAARVAYVAQKPQVGAAFSVEEVVRLGRYALPSREGAVDRAIEAMDLTQRRGSLFAELSAGQQQRVSLARAFAQLDAWGEQMDKPGALLADEPTSALDPRHAMETMGALREAASRGVAVGVALHDLTTALRFADSAIVLDAQGRVTARGAAGETLTPVAMEAVFGVPFVVAASAAGPVLAPVAAARGGAGRYNRDL